MEKLRMAAGLQEKLEISALEDGAGNPISALTIMSLLERVAGIIDSVQSSQQRMEERQQDLENNIKNIQGDVLKLAKDHASTGSTVDKLLQKTRKVSANVKEVRARVEKQNVRVKKVESTQDELLTRNRFRVVIYQGDAQIPSVTVNKVPKGVGLDGVEVEADSYAAPPDLSSDEEYLSVEEPDATRGARMKKSMMKSTEGLRSAFSKENMAKTRGNIGNKMHNLGEKVVPPERREKMHAAGARLKENIAKHAPTKETFHIKLKKERTVAEGQEGAEGLEGAEEEAVAAKEDGAKGRKSPGVAYTEVVERERPVEEAGATRIAEEEGKE